MKKTILFIFSLFIFSANAEVKLISFYFDSDTDSLTKGSKEELNGILEKQYTSEFQIIEMNSYGPNISTSCQYSELILQILNLKKETINYNCLGSKKELLSFTPHGWNRVDVYYFLGDSILPSQPILIVERKQPEVKEKVIKIEIKEESDPKIIEDIPVVLPVKFKGGTADVLASSTICLEELYELLRANKEYNVAIKGHVCCENNRKMSKKRAKVVFEYLVDKGISKDRLSFEGFSNLNPIVFPERSEKDRAKNRRVELVFSKK